MVSSDNINTIYILIHRTLFLFLKKTLNIGQTSVVTSNMYIVILYIQSLLSYNMQKKKKKTGNFKVTVPENSCITIKLSQKHRTL